MNNLGQGRGRGRAQALRRRIRPNKVRKLRLKLAVFADQRVIFGIRNLWRVLVVVELVVMRNLLGQAHQPVGSPRFGYAAFVHSIPASNSAMRATLFMFLAVPSFRIAIFSFESAMPP